MKPGLRTTEFWLTIAVDLAALLTAVSDVLPARFAVAVSTVATGLYAISRGWAKSGNGGGTPPA